MLAWPRSILGPKLFNLFTDISFRPTWTFPTLNKWYPLTHDEIIMCKRTLYEGMSLKAHALKLLHLKLAVSTRRQKHFRWKDLRIITGAFNYRKCPRSVQIVFNSRLRIQVGVCMHLCLYVVAKNEGKRPLGRRRRWWKDVIAVDVREIRCVCVCVCVWTVFMLLRAELSSRMVRTRQLTVGGFNTIGGVLDELSIC
jgi:hypothetical protein